MHEPFTQEEVYAIYGKLIGIEGVYRDTRTGFVGQAIKPQDPLRLRRSRRDGRPMILLCGASPKRDRDMEHRTVYLDDLEYVGGDPVGFGKGDVDG